MEFPPESPNDVIQISIAPENWITLWNKKDSTAKIVWPRNDVSKKIRNKVKPEQQWKSYDVYVKYSKIETYEAARAKEKKINVIGGTDTEIEKLAVGKARKLHPVTHNVSNKNEG